MAIITPASSRFSNGIRLFTCRSNHQGFHKKREREGGENVPKFEVVSPYEPAGDQLQAIDSLARGVELGLDEQDLENAIREKVPEKFLELNMKALAFSRE